MKWLQKPDYNHNISAFAKLEKRTETYSYSLSLYDPPYFCALINSLVESLLVSINFFSKLC